MITWLRAQLDEDEAWARAASKPYPYADDGAKAPDGGVHWQWAAGENWEPVTPNPVLDEFVAEPGHPCYLLTVEEWPTNGRQSPNKYAYEIVEMDSAAAGHIVRHDPARVLAEVAAKRLIIADHSTLHTIVDGFCVQEGGACTHAGESWCNWHGTDNCSTVRLLAVPYADRVGYLEEWRP